MTQAQINQILYRLFGILPYPQTPQNKGNANQINQQVTPYKTINGAPISYSCNYGQNPPTPTDPEDPPTES